MIADQMMDIHDEMQKQLIPNVKVRENSIQKLEKLEKIKFQVQKGH